MPRTLRAYELVIGKPITLSLDYFSPMAGTTGRLLELEDYYDRNAVDGYLITDHEMSFDIKKTEDSAKNVAEIQVKNLSKSLIKYVMSNRGKDLYVRLSVGYVGEVKKLFEGTLKDSSASDDNVDTILTLSLVDGIVNSQAITSRVYPKGTKFSIIADDLRKDSALPVGRIVPIPENLVTPTPLSLFGNSYDKLAVITNLFDYSFSVESGKCYILPKKDSLQDSVAYISANSGLIGSVQNLIVKNDKHSATAATESNSERIRFSCQMDASIYPPLSVYVYDPKGGYDGIYKVERAAFASSGFNQGSWRVTVDCIKNETLVRA